MARRSAGCTRGCGHDAAGVTIRFPLTQVSGFLTSGGVVLAATILLQLLIGATVGLYSSEGRGTWPVRLASAAIVGAVAGLVAAVAMGMEQGVSREAIISQVPLFGFGGALWRAFVGLLVRRQRQKELSDRFGGADLVEIGSDLGSMTGGVLRTWGYRHLL